jgi:uncharacterized sulfatase
MSSRRVRRWALLSLPLAASAFVACGLDDAVEPPETPPNIVLVVSDDQGWSDFGFMGSTVVQTPRLDALAAGGYRFSLAFNTGNVCRPSLRSLLTGYHPAQYEARVDALQRADPAARGTAIRRIETLPRLLATRGYVSFQGGKYWEGDARHAGFDEAMATGASVREAPAPAADHLGSAALARLARSPLFRAAGGESLSLGRTTMEPLLRFIDAHADRPFFVWFAPLLPHTPFDASEADRAPFAEAGLPEPAIGYYANVTRLDRRIGELLDHLERRGLRDRTLVVFLADNGWEVGRVGDPQDAIMGGPHGKRSIADAAFRTPLVLSWPGRIAPTVDADHVVSSVDLFPTLLELAGVETPADRWGESLAPLVTAAGPFARQSAMAVVRRLREPPGGRFPFVGDRVGLFLRTRDWRLVRLEPPGSRALYSMVDDPLETEDRCADRPDLCAHLARELALWRRAVEASPPVPRPRALGEPEAERDTRPETD